MNDNELITALREQRGKVAMTTPVEQIISRGRSVRARRRIPRVAAAVAPAAAAATVVSVALPAGHLAKGPDARLAAWTVTREADGDIQITFLQATDPAGLQSTLRADGVPASVTFAGQQNPACQTITVPVPPFSDKGADRGPLSRVVVGFADKPAQDVLVLRPSGLPTGDGIQISTSGTPGAADSFRLFVNLVQQSPQCTGS